MKKGKQQILSVRLDDGKSFGSPSWYNGRDGEIFQVVTAKGYVNYYYVVENGVITTKMLPRKSCTRLDLI
jgi:hypothetical protein